MPRNARQHAICPYMLNKSLSTQSDAPIDPIIIKAAVITKITFLPTISAIEPAPI